MSARELITDYLDLWTAAVTQKRSGGRGNNGKIELTGIKKLRELILELAVRGKLVEQDPSDEPASVLLERIAEEKARLVKEGKIKKPKKQPEITEEEEPFELPSAWEWARLTDVYYSISPSGRNIKSSEVSDEGAFPVVDQGQSHIAGYHDDESLVIRIPHPVVVFGDHTTARKYIDFEFIAGADGTKTLCPVIVDPKYFHLHLLQYDLENRGYARHFKVLNEQMFAVPPLHEQRKIVDKVDELMALCDRLEQQVGDQLEAHEVLVDTLLDALTRSANAAEVAENWARIAEHFDTLFTTEASIDKLKQAILQLAVMGRLVEQDSDDEPASVLLERIAEEKAHLVKEGKIKKLKRLPEPSIDEVPFELPHSWQWCRLPDIGELARGKSKHRPRNHPSLYLGGTIPLIQTGDVARADREISTYTALYNEAGVAQSKLWPTGTLCITIAANIGDTGILGFEACFPDSVVGFTPYTTDIKNEYFEYFLRTAKRNLEEFAPSTAQKNINLDVLQNILVPLPPANELRRVVDKVDELMALCDQLKACLGEAGETRAHLAEAVTQSVVR